MRVFVVTWNEPGEPGSVEGVFTSLEKAKYFVEYIRDQTPGVVEIEEHELDDSDSTVRHVRFEASTP